MNRPAIPSPASASRWKRRGLASLAVASVVAGLSWWLFMRHRETISDISWTVIETSIARRFPAVAHIDTRELAAWRADPTRPQPLVIDVRSREEFDVSHLPGAIHAEKVEDILPLLGGAAEERPLVVYCSVGWRSAVVAEALRQSGRTNVHNLKGSIFQWANEDRPLECDGQPVRVVHPFDHKWGVLLARERRPETSTP